MLKNKFKALAEARSLVARLESSIAAELKQELAGLPAEYGFDSTRAFVAAVTSASDRRRRRGAGRRSAVKPAAGKQRRRAKITDETRAELKKLVAAGKPGAEIARSLGISLPSVQNIKKALGLVKKRK